MYKLTYCRTGCAFFLHFV